MEDDIEITDIGEADRTSGSRSYELIELAKLPDTLSGGSDTTECASSESPSKSMTEIEGCSVNFMRARKKRKTRQIYMISRTGPLVMAHLT